MTHFAAERAELFSSDGWSSEALSRPRGGKKKKKERGKKSVSVHRSLQAGRASKARRNLCMLKHFKGIFPFSDNISFADMYLVLWLDDS